MAYTDEMLDVAYIWMHNDMRIRDKDLKANPHIVINGGQLDIINATFAEAGDYECIVKSTVGRISSRTTITIEGPPGPPGGIQVLNVIKTSVDLSWTDGAYNGRLIDRYTISARTNWNQTWFNLTEGTIGLKDICVILQSFASFQSDNFLTDFTSYTVGDRNTGRKRAHLENVLRPFTTYEFRIQAGNELGYGSPSLSSPQYSTPSDKPVVAPSNIRGGGGKLGDLTIKWDPLKSSEQYGPGIFYKVYWRRKKGESEFQSLALKEHGNVGMSVVPIQSQYYYTEYEVMVQAANDVGYGPKSEIFTIYSAEDMPQVRCPYFLHE